MQNTMKSTPEESEKPSTGLDRFRQAAEEASKMPLPTYEEREEQFKRNNEQIRLMETVKDS